MTDLSRLRVSLTKHGAHKVYRLIEHFASKDVLANTWDKYDGIKIDRAQAARNLSALPDNDIPAIWSSAKDRSTETLKRLVFLGILFSHHQLIKAFTVARTKSGRGRINRGDVINGKAFTNLKNDLQELGLSAAATADFVDYDLRPIFSDPLLVDLAAELIRLKLIEAKWNTANTLLDECVRVGFHTALSLEESAFRKWLTEASPVVPASDELPEVVDPDKSIVTAFLFRAGHSTKKSGSAAIATKTKKPKPAKLLHNEIQNALYNILAAEFGADNVGTELDSATFGTSVDLVVRTGTDFDFYEIKTSISVKKCLRQAIAQLLEYAFWPDQTRARRLIVVAQAKVTTDAKKYLSHLRTTVGVPIYYASIDMERGKVSKLS